MGLQASSVVAGLALSVLGSAALTAHSNQPHSTSAALFAAIVLYVAAGAALGLGLSLIAPAPTGHRPTTTRHR